MQFFWDLSDLTYPVADGLAHSSKLVDGAMFLSHCWQSLPGPSHEVPYSICHAFLLRILI